MGCILLCLDVIGCLTVSSLGVQRMAVSIEEASMIFLDRAASKMMGLMESFLSCLYEHTDHDIEPVQHFLDGTESICYFFPLRGYSYC